MINSTARRRTKWIPVEPSEIFAAKSSADAFPLKMPRRQPRIMLRSEEGSTDAPPMPSREAAKESSLGRKPQEPAGITKAPAGRKNVGAAF